jgi:hypothetical protein
MAQLSTSDLQLLLRVSDKRSIPTLMDLQAYLIDTDQKWQIRRRITDLLPTLCSSDSEIIPSQYLNRLAESINSRWSDRGDVQFAVAALKACQLFGDEHTTPIVFRLARSARNDQIRQAARECLPGLLARRQRLRTGSGLLRPANPLAECEKLLRASAPSRAPHAQLLRPEIVGTVAAIDE